MGADMGGADVEDELLLAYRLLRVDGAVQRLMFPSVGKRIRRHLRRPAGIALPQRVSLPVVGHDQSAQVRMALEAYPEQVEHFPFIPVGGRPDVGDGIGNGIFSGQAHFQAQSSGRLKRKKMINEGKVRIDLLRQAMEGTRFAAIRQALS